MWSAKEGHSKTAFCDIVAASNTFCAERLFDDDPSRTVTYESNGPPGCPLRPAMFLDDLQETICPFRNAESRDGSLPICELLGRSLMYFIMWPLRWLNL